MFKKSPDKAVEAARKALETEQAALDKAVAAEEAARTAAKKDPDDDRLHSDWVRERDRVQLRRDRLADARQALETAEQAKAESERSALEKQHGQLRDQLTRPAIWKTAEPFVNEEASLWLQIAQVRLKKQEAKAEHAKIAREAEALEQKLGIQPRIPAAAEIGYFDHQRPVTDRLRAIRDETTDAKLRDEITKLLPDPNPILDDGRNKPQLNDEQRSSLYERLTKQQKEALDWASGRKAAE